MRNLSSPGRGWVLLALLSLAALISVRLSLDRAGLQVIQIIFSYVVPYEIEHFELMMKGLEFTFLIARYSLNKTFEKNLNIACRIKGLDREFVDNLATNYAF